MNKNAIDKALADIRKHRLGWIPFLISTTRTSRNQKSGTQN